MDKNLQTIDIVSVYMNQQVERTYVVKAMEKYKSAGMDKVIQEAQKQYDEWKKTNK